MAQKTSKRRVTGTQDATFATFITELNTILATFDGTGIPGDANATKSINDVDIFWDGTNYTALVDYNEFSVPA